MSQVPRTLVYDTGVPPLPFDKRIKRIWVLPTGTYNQSLSQQDIVRFNLKEARDFIDPWSVQLEITVEIPAANLAPDGKFTDKVIQLDGSAQSFIQNLVWYDPQGRELERINQYGRLANFLNQMKYNPQERSGTDQYGAGGLNLGTIGKQVGAIPAPSNKIYSMAVPMYEPQGAGTMIQAWSEIIQKQGYPMQNQTSDAWGWTQVSPLGGYVNSLYNLALVNSGQGLPTSQYGNMWDNAFQLTGPFQGMFNASGNWIQGIFGGSGSGIPFDGGNYDSNFNPLWWWKVPTEDWSEQPPLTINNLSAAWSPVNYWSPLRNNSVIWELSPFMAWDTTMGAGPISTQNGAPPCTIALVDAYYGTGPSIVSTTTQIEDRVCTLNNLNQSLFYNSYNPLNKNKGATFPLEGIFNGFADPFPANFMTAPFEPMFSTSVLQRVMENGIPQAKKVTQWTFTIPLMSGFLGHLIEEHNYKLIPMKVMKDIVLELTFNQYALFTSWHSTNVNNRAYNIKDIRLGMDTMIIEDSGLYNAIAPQFDSFSFSSQSFYLGPQYTITNNAVPAELQMNLRFESLKNVYFGFYRQLYNRSTAARWNYRLSHNITQYYIQYGTEVFPSVPFEGNAGTNYGPNNNYEFINQLRNALGYNHVPIQGAINPHNFSINFSEFNPEDGENAQIDPRDDERQIQRWVKQMDTDNNQLCFFKENRIQGAAMFAVPCQVMENDPTVWSGINTTVGSSMSLFLQYNAGNNYRGNSEFVSWLNYNLTFIRSGDGFIVRGRV